MIACWSSRVMGTWTPPQSIVFGTGNDLLDWLEDESWGSKRMYIVAPSAADAATLCTLWDRWQTIGATWCDTSGAGASTAASGGSTWRYRIRSRVTSLRTTILDYERYGRRYTWTSLSQYLPMTEDAIAEMVGFKWSDSDGRQDEGYAVAKCAEDQCRLTLRAMQWLCDWWRVHRGGQWAASLGGLSFQWLRHRLLPREVCTHRHDEALALERHACYGGRVSCWYVGDVRPRIELVVSGANRPPRSSYPPVDGPVHSVDIRSMYASLMRDRTYPVKLIGYEHGMTTRDCRDLLRTCGIIAACELVTDEAEYPYRSNDGVYYPTGRFATILAGPDLADALDRGRVSRIGRAAIYQMGTPLHHAASALLAIRDKVDVRNDRGGHTLAKLLANASTGKLAQRKADWRPRPDHPGQRDSGGRPILWGDWLESRPDPSWRPEDDIRRVVAGAIPHQVRPRLLTRFRSIAGLVEQHVRAEHGTGTLQAIYAYLTAYGRAMMRDIRRTLPARSVLVQDTDGLWVTTEGVAALRSSGALSSSLPGCLRLDKVIRSARIYGPKHYWADGVWTLAGFHDPVYTQHDNVVAYDQTANPIRGNPRSAPDHITTYRRRTELLLIASHGNMGDDGWITPYVLPHRA